MQKISQVSPLQKLQRGIYSILFALGATVLVGFVGLAIDTSRHMVVIAELQSAADACALAAAYELNGGSDSVTRAFSVGKFVGGQKNLKGFQNTPTAIADDDILFGTNIDGTFSTRATASSSSRLVRCIARQNSYLNYFLGVINILNSNLTAVATATVLPSVSTCSISMGICTKNPAAANFGWAVGERIVLDDTSTKGYFTWADVTASSGVLKDIYAQPLVNNGTCDTATINGNCIGIKTGVMSSMTDEWNTRFGLYKNGVGYTPLNAVPDRTGFGYIGGFNLSNYLNIQTPSRSPYQSNLGGSAKLTAEQHSLLGATGRRLTAIPVVNCLSSGQCPASITGKAFLPIVGWACVLMLEPVQSFGSQSPAIEYVGNAASQSSPCISAGVPGGTTTFGPLVPALVQ